MALNTEKGNLVIIDATTVYWKGAKVIGVEEILLQSDLNEHRVRLRIRDGDAAIMAELTAAGVRIKEV